MPSIREHSCPRCPVQAAHSSWLALCRPCPLQHLLVFLGCPPASLFFARGCDTLRGHAAAARLTCHASRPGQQRRSCGSSGLNLDITRTESLSSGDCLLVVVIALCVLAVTKSSSLPLSASVSVRIFSLFGPPPPPSAASPPSRPASRVSLSFPPSLPSRPVSPPLCIPSQNQHQIKSVCLAVHRQPALLQTHGPALRARRPRQL